MDWKYIPAQGTAGGILLGFRSATMSVVRWQEYKYCVMAIAKNCQDNFVWRLVIVYGSPYEESKMEFIEELQEMMESCQGPTMLGGDFNIVRAQKEKSNGVVNFKLNNCFNEWINRWGLLDIKDPTRSYSWTNNQEKSIMDLLDRILVSVDWEAKFPLAQVVMLPRGTSDHNPLKISFGDMPRMKEHVFRFKKWWLEMEEFMKVVRKAWEINPTCSDPMGVWQFKIRTVRKKLWGWSRNRDAELKRNKTKILKYLDELDAKAKLIQLSVQEEEERKELRKRIEKNCQIEEIKVRQRS
jgi:hypothetical protein